MNLIIMYMIAICIFIRLYFDHVSGMFQSCTFCVIICFDMVAATLGLAIYAKRHADVWDAAAALLREHCHHLSSHRIQSLYDNLKAAGSQMSPKDKARPGKGPPPILYLTGPCPLDGPHSLHLLKVESLKDSSISPITSPKGTGNPFLYDAFAARRKHRNGSGKEDSNHAVTWVCGEPGKVEVEICNPCPIPIKVRFGQIDFGVIKTMRIYLEKALFCRWKGSC